MRILIVTDFRSLYTFKNTFTIIARCKCLKDLFRKFIGSIHSILKTILKKRLTTPRYHFVNMTSENVWPVKFSIKSNVVDYQYINDDVVSHVGEIKLQKNELFPTENVISNGIKPRSIMNKKANVSQIENSIQTSYHSLLKRFIVNSRIPNGWRYEGLHFAGYILDKKRWCLPSWVWTNAAIVRYYIQTGDIENAVDLADRLLNLQLDSGGWIVRWDFKNPNKGVSPIIAPNDSAYIARNALLTVYEITQEKKYLAGAIKCAEWIMENGHSNNLILIGYDIDERKWLKEYNIVDIGFTADFFCKLYELTNQKKHIEFAKSFLKRYLEVFYLGKGNFTTSVNSTGRKLGGIFARGQAWALEGLIPYYEITLAPEIEKVIYDTVSNLINSQSSNGAWLYNLRKSLRGWASGYDCKGTPVIAHAINRCSKLNLVDDSLAKKTIDKSIKWCKKNTSKKGEAAGGIFSYNFEGAIVHSHYTSTAFVYANAYLGRLLKERGLL